MGAEPDFNHDGFADLVLPSTGEEVDGVNGAGAVFVIYGSAAGSRVAHAAMDPELGWHPR